MMMRAIKAVVFYILNMSLNLASNEQGLRELKRKLANIVPDLTNQYSSFQITGLYQINKVRSQHAFQVQLALDAISLVNKAKGDPVNVIDIGDSSGAHLTYLSQISGEVCASSVNLDPIAVEKIRSKGFEATLSKAELLHEHPDFNKRTDIFLSYETLEHLLDPISFLHNMAIKSDCEYFVITIPYLKRSRVGLHQVRHPEHDRPFNAETTHIFELSPDDWNLVFEFSGWKVVKQVKYTQYPKKNPLTILRYFWRRFDFDGFYGVILKKDNTASSKYKSW
jgi:hypothetical protein